MPSTAVLPKGIVRKQQTEMGKDDRTVFLKHKNGANIIISLHYNYRFVQVFSERKDLQSIRKPLLMETCLVAGVKDAETCFGKKAQRLCLKCSPGKASFQALTLRPHLLSVQQSEQNLKMEAKV